MISVEEAEKNVTNLETALIQAELILKEAKHKDVSGKLTEIRWIPHNGGGVPYFNSMELRLMYRTREGDISIYSGYCTPWTYGEGEPRAFDIVQYAFFTKK